MSKILKLAVVMLLVTSTTSFADDDDDKKKRRGNRDQQEKKIDGEKGKRGKAKRDDKARRAAPVMEGIRKLDLNQDQKAEVKEVMAKFRKAMSQMRERVKNADGEVDRKAVRERAGKIRKEMMSGLMEILTAEQKAKLRKMRSERQDRAEGEGGRRGKRGKKGAQSDRKRGGKKKGKGKGGDDDGKKRRRPVESDA